MAFFGLLIGSFINALAWRIHEHKSIVNERSMCPNCHHQLAASDLVPVLSWLWLRGKCRYCRRPISVQYPCVELLTAGLFILTYLSAIPTGVGGWLELIFRLVFVASLITLAVYDVRWLILPDVVVLPLIILAVGRLLVLLAAAQPTHSYLGPILAAGLVGGLFYALAAVSDGRWMGGGDIKLVFLIGLVLGLKATAVAMFIAFNAAAIVGLILIGLHRHKLRQHLPFGPFLALGAIIGLFYATPIIHWYLSLGGMI